MRSQPAQAATGRGLGYWRRHLASVEWPATSSAATLQEFSRAELLSPRLLDAINCDLPLGLVLLMEGQRFMRHGNRVSSIPHAVGVLGQTRIQSLMRKMGAKHLDPAQPGHARYAEAVMTSQLAGHLLMQCLASQTQDEVQAQVWSLQVQTLAAWKLPLAAPEVAEELALRIARGEREAHAERAVLGCRMHELNAVVAQDMGLLNAETAVLVQPMPPRMLGQAARLAWQDMYAPEIPTEVGRWLFQPATLPSLLQMLAHEAMKSWYSARTTLLLQVLSAHRHKRLDDVVRLTRKAALAASRASSLTQIVPAPALRLLWPPVPRRRPGAAPAAPARSALPARVAAASPALDHMAQTVLDRFVADCDQSRHPNLASFFKAFARALQEGLGLRRYALFLKTTQDERLVCFVAQGFAGAIVPRQFKVSLTDNNLLARLFVQPNGFLMAEPARLAQIRPLLPQALRAELYPCGAMWATIQVKERPVGVLWADGWGQDAPVHAAQYAGFKHLSRHFGPTLTRLMQQQKQAAAAV